MCRLFYLKDFQTIIFLVNPKTNSTQLFLKNDTPGMSFPSAVGFGGKLPTRRKFEFLWAFPSVSTYPDVGITWLKKIRHVLLESKLGNVMFSLSVSCLELETRRPFRLLSSLCHVFVLFSIHALIASDWPENVITGVVSLWFHQFKFTHVETKNGG